MQAEAKGSASFASGDLVIANGRTSVAMGMGVRAGPSDYCFAFGGGSTVDTLVNDIERSFIVGFDTTAALVVRGSTNNVGIGTRSPHAKLHVDGDLQVGRLWNGKAGNGYDVDFYSGTMGGAFRWIEDEMALRAGCDTDGSHWASDSIGMYSVAFGRNTKAIGTASFAAGWGTRADGGSSIAMGDETEATADYSTAIGAGSSAGGAYAVALGQDADASGYGSTAMGSQTEASDYYSTALGWGSKATGSASIGAGYLAFAGGDYSCALGHYVETTADTAIALGSGIDPGSRLTNSTSNSLIVGFNTTDPTLFVGGSNHAVGVATTTPNGPLHVQNSTINIDAGSNLADRIAPLVVGDGDGTSVCILIDGNQIEQAQGSQALNLNHTSSSNILLANGGGEVGVGTTTPSSKLHINGAHGYEQLRLHDSYTPTSPGDSNGETGDIAWDDDYIYVKTAGGWKRADLSTWR
jgi:hypothetical protein